MSMATMREYVRNAYPGPNWKRKVDHMRNDQVIAIYKSLRSRKQKKPQIILDEIPAQSHQLTIWDFLSRDKN